MDKTDLSAVRNPIERANGLPNAHYINHAVFEEERAALLVKGWAGLAVAADVPEPGDALPVQFLDMPLLMVRDKSGTVRVFQNTCRHRGMILVDAPRNIAGAIRCPYHSWCYATDGRLVATPHVGGPGQNTADGIDRSLLGLVEVKSHIWMDVVWINISGDAPKFEIANAELLDRWAEFDKPLYHGGPTAGSNSRSPAIGNWQLKTTAKAIICLGSIPVSTAIPASKIIIISKHLSVSPGKARGFIANSKTKPGKDFQISRG